MIKLNFHRSEYTLFMSQRKRIYRLLAPFSFGDPTQPIQYPVIVKLKLPVSQG